MELKTDLPGFDWLYDHCLRHRRTLEELCAIMCLEAATDNADILWTVRRPSALKLGSVVALRIALCLGRSD